LDFLTAFVQQARDNFLRFYSLADLQLQMSRYLRRANRIPMAVLGNL